MSDEVKHDILCCDCGGWPIDKGAVFIATVFIREGETIHGYICELCYLQRLKRRAWGVNITSGPQWQIDIPDLGIERIPPRPKPIPPPRRPRIR